MLLKMRVGALLIAAVALGACTKKETSSPQAETPVQDTIKGSPAATAKGDINGCIVTVSYHSPAVRGRIIWGGLVPYDRVWVTGAHMATSVEFSREVRVDDKVIGAGKYAFFTVPGKDQWTLILNSNWQQHLTDDYDYKLDVVRLTVEPEVQDEHHERLLYDIDQRGEHRGAIIVYWEKLSVSLPFICR